LLDALGEAVRLFDLTCLTEAIQTGKLEDLREEVRLLEVTCLAKGHSDREIRSPAPST